MTLEEILSLPIGGSNVLIIGMPASGKSWLSNQFQTRHQKLHTDDYLPFGEVRAAWGVIEDNYHYQPTMVEGMLGYALLKIGYEQKAYYPKVVIQVEISRAKQREIYLKERDPEKIKYLKRFNEMNLGILNEYFKNCPKEDQATFYTFNNDY